MSLLKKAEQNLKREIFDKITARDESNEERNWYESIKQGSYKKGDKLHDKLTIIAKRLAVQDYLLKKSREGIDSRTDNKDSHD